MNSLEYMNPKQAAVQLYACTWIEIMTGVGITLYLLYLHSYQLAALTVMVFAPLSDSILQSTGYLATNWNQVVVLSG
ncbi:MAG: hypothetical protein ACJ707_06705 [Nitrososphaera sp.]